MTCPIDLPDALDALKLGQALALTPNHAPDWADHIKGYSGASLSERALRCPTYQHAEKLDAMMCARESAHWRMVRRPVNGSV